MTEYTLPQPLGPQDVEAMLAMATTGDLGASTMHSAIDLSKLTAFEIFSAVHHVREAESRVPYLASHDWEPTPQDRRLDEYSSDLENAFDQLQALIDPEKMRDVFTMLATSTSPIDQKFAGAYIGTLTRVDREYGLELWKRLLEDNDHDVSSHTWNVATTRYFDDTSSPDSTMKKLTEDGITWRDLQDLINTYVRRLEDFRDRNTYPDGLAS